MRKINIVLGDCFLIKADFYTNVRTKKCKFDTFNESEYDGNF